MRFITVRELRNTPTTVWSALDEGDLVLTSNGDPVAVLVRVEDDLEDTLAAVRRARGQQAVSRLRRQSADAETARLTELEIEAEIAAARRDRKRT
jgi:hypothetical protein